MLAAHDPSEGGLAVAAAEMVFAGGLGLELDLQAVPAKGRLPSGVLLFSESPTRLLLEVAPGDLERVKQALGPDVPWASIGRVVEAPVLRVRAPGGDVVLERPLARLERAWREPLFQLYGAGGGA